MSVVPSADSCFLIHVLYPTSYQLAPSFVGFAELNDAAYVQTILNVING